MCHGRGSRRAGQGLDDERGGDGASAFASRSTGRCWACAWGGGAWTEATPSIV
jgi:hypothetical protein